MSNLENKGIEYWVDQLSNSDMPVLSNVVAVLNKLTGDDDAEFNQLAEVILKDPHLTTQILKLVNSVQYNPSGSSISTISRAIVLLGFRKVHSLCLSLMVVDSLLSKKPRERLLDNMAKAFYTAVQARGIYKQISQNPTEQEEVFIAALLFNLGEMIFWAYGGKSADALDIELTKCVQSNCSNALIEKELGTSFKSLSRELSKAWNLGDILQVALSSKGIVAKGSLGLQAQAVVFANSLSRLREDQVEERGALLQQIAKFMQCKTVDATKILRGAAEQATKVAVDFGAPEVCHLVPKIPIGEQVEKPKEIKKEDDKPLQVLSSDPHLQLKVLRDLANASAESMDMNAIFQTALEGMHRGIGLERMVLAFFNRDQIRAKYVLGERTEGWRDKFVFNVGSEEHNIFSENIQKPQPVWIDNTYINTHKYLYTETTVKVIGVHEAFIGVLKVNNRNAVMFYADRSKTGQPLNKEQFEAFGHFLTQTEFSIQAIAGKRRA